MIGKNWIWAVGAAIVGLMLPSQAMAQYDAHTRADLNLRVGPGTEYGVIDVIPAGYPVDVLGCLESYAWCDVDWDGLRGWVAARYLVQPGTTVYLAQYAPRVGVPIITFSFGTYHDRYYRDRPWYRERYGRWRGRDYRRERRRDAREERRDLQELQEQRRETQQQRRNTQQQRRNTQQQRRETQQQRRETQQQRRETQQQRRATQQQRQETQEQRRRRQQQRQQTD